MQRSVAHTHWARSIDHLIPKPSKETFGETEMRQTTRDIGNVLLRWHREFCRPTASRAREQRRELNYGDILGAVIGYDALCVRAGLPSEYAHACRNDLYAISDWCSDRDFPPINALVVQTPQLQKGIAFPGSGYFETSDHIWRLP